MMNYRGSGMCVMEMSHRSPVYQQIIDEAEQDLRDLISITAICSMTVKVVDRLSPDWGASVYVRPFSSRSRRHST